ncbi:MAG TPA: hypothetical protein VLA97_16015 [Nocardioidaceae bacterium]|jgi:hypothetical protein|nr:hypothetical protein [Nocardioidaceae bacterium]
MNKLLSRVFSPRGRAYIYHGLLGTAPLAVGYGWVTGEQAALWLGALAAWLGTGLAVVHTPRPPRI